MIRRSDMRRLIWVYTIFLSPKLIWISKCETFSIYQDHVQVMRIFVVESHQLVAPFFNVPHFFSKIIKTRNILKGGKYYLRDIICIKEEKVRTINWFSDSGNTLWSRGWQGANVEKRRTGRTSDPGNKRYERDAGRRQLQYRQNSLCKTNERINF